MPNNFNNGSRVEIGFQVGEESIEGDYNVSMDDSRAPRSVSVSDHPRVGTDTGTTSESATAVNEVKREHGEGDTRPDGSPKDKDGSDERAMKSTDAGTTDTSYSKQDDKADGDTGNTGRNLVSSYQVSGGNRTYTNKGNGHIGIQSGRTTFGGW